MSSNHTGVNTKMFKFVEVHWLDAVSHAEWREVEDLDPPAKMVTRGWLVKDEDKYVSLAGTLGVEDHGKFEVGDAITIPRGMVERIKVLKV